MHDAEADVLACMTFPKERRVKLHSTNPLERVNGEIKRRTEAGAIFLEQNDGWALQRCRHMSLETSAPLSDNPLVSLPACRHDVLGSIQPAITMSISSYTNLLVH